ncbi:MAG: hypothetical protein H7A21_18600 [Spirochaetales bacterium]|nr:hypothetical protein [Leptospiraceae bacterium]MCP5483453.1 hypothetical protein [Spirochaetales bacterium]MCP5486559.1 hypothetical protein [Spirochaetales bacterium]
MRLTRLLLALAIVLGLSLCANPFEIASCRRDCDQKHEACLLTAALFATSPGGSPGTFTLLFLNCQSAFYICDDTCEGNTSR